MTIHENYIRSTLKNYIVTYANAEYAKTYGDYADTLLDYNFCLCPQLNVNKLGEIGIIVITGVQNKEDPRLILEKIEDLNAKLKKPSNERFPFLHYLKRSCSTLQQFGFFVYKMPKADKKKCIEMARINSQSPF